MTVCVVAGAVGVTMMVAASPVTVVMAVYGDGVHVRDVEMIVGESELAAILGIMDELKSVYNKS